MSASGAVPIAKPAVDTVDIGERARLAARRRERMLSVASPVALLLAWELAARFGWIDVRFFPAPSAIMVALFGMAQTGEL
jgi:ABC-type nitrate/sulfonate/bicarbonate transport system permease component